MRFSSKWRWSQEIEQEAGIIWVEDGNYAAFTSQQMIQTINPGVYYQYRKLILDGECQELECMWGMDKS